MIIGILTVTALGFFLFSSMTGSVITGAAIKPEIKDESFRIDSFGSQMNENESNDTFEEYRKEGINNGKNNS